MLEIRLPDGSIKKIAPETTVIDFAKGIGPGLAKAALAGRLDGKWLDLRAPIPASGSLEIVTNKHPLASDVIRHSAEHVMADAVKRLWPKVQIDVGRTDHSEKFQYDFKMDRPFTPEDLVKIEKKMGEILKEKSEFTRESVDRKTAEKIFTDLGELLKVDRLKDIPEGEAITIFRHGAFADLCRGPHVQSTSQIGAIKILESSASYWRGDEANEVLQRVYGTAFCSKKELEEYLARLEEAKRRDHRKIGKELKLFSINEEIGPGLILWHPKGALIRTLIEDFWRKEHLSFGYDFVYSPHVAKKELWETSGHTSFYQDSMFTPMELEKQEFLVKPMNCPFHIQIYNSDLRSYRELPIRYAELGTVYRFEKSGVLHGLLRVRGFTQDDAHHFVRPDQMKEEIERLLDFVIHRFFETFGFTEYEIFLSTRPPKSVGTDEEWEMATRVLREALETKGIKFEEDPGEGVFYGPKIDIKVKDALGRAWQCTTIQVDFNLPARFHLEFVDADGSKRAPIMIHRALLGSMERFFGCLVEHYAGAFPLWLSPVQVKILPITDQHKPYAEEIRQYLSKEGFRVEVDARNEKLGFKIREAQLEKVPYMVVVGEEEATKRQLSVRKRNGEKLPNMTPDAFSQMCKEEDQSRS